MRNGLSCKAPGILLRHGKNHSRYFIFPKDRPGMVATLYPRSPQPAPDIYFELLGLTLFYLFYSFSPLTTCTLSGLDIYLYLVFPSTRSCATSDNCPTSLPVALLVHTPTFIGI